jgi:hypothetical protein
VPTTTRGGDGEGEQGDDGNGSEMQQPMMIARCSLMISGLGYYKAWLEGQLLDDHELGESMQFQRQLPYDAVDCTPHAQRALAAAAAAAAAAARTSTSGKSKANATAASTTPLTLAVALGRGWYGEQEIMALGNHPSGPRMLRTVFVLVLVCFGLLGGCKYGFCHQP